MEGCGRRRSTCVVASLVGLAGVLFCLIGSTSPGAAQDLQTIQVWPDRSLGVSSGMWEPSAVPTPTQVLPLGVSRATGSELVQGRTYLHFPPDVFPPNTEILHATLYVYVDSASGTGQQVSLGTYRVLDPWGEEDGGADPATWPRVQVSPIAVTTARFGAGSPLRPTSPPVPTAPSSPISTPTARATETSTRLSKPPGHGLLQGTWISLDPQTPQVDVGATTAVDIRVENVSDLSYAEVYLTFDPELLEVVDSDSSREGVQIQPGAFLGPDFEENIVYPGEGEIEFAQTALDEPASGTGILATIVFRGKAVGSTRLEFTAVILQNPELGFIDFEIENGIAVVGRPGSPIATPSDSPLATPTRIPPTSTPGATLTPTPSVTPQPGATPAPPTSPPPTLPPPPTAAGVALEPVPGTWLTWDVTALMRAWLAGEVPDDGLALAPAPEPDADPEAAGDLLVARYLTANDPDTRPYVIVGYRVLPTTPTPVPGLPPAGRPAGGWRGAGLVIIGMAVILLGLAVRRK